MEKIGRDLKYYRQMKMIGMLSGSVSIYHSISVSIYHSAIAPTPLPELVIAHT